MFNAMQHCVMLRCRAYGNATKTADSAKNCVVIAFGSATREHHFTGLATQSCGNKITCFV
jgi:hypothetical protein